ncbi:V-type ATP synthase subunit D [Borrelia miyamotoi]|uniref:V-type ATP synthase subunit D n=1 Tax=Borrelia miyamotoi TaxID=47466 RepID=A0AAX3JN84_9SPIR|nr:V-type ATP synthase subunit D [Borrelia miyamotoi]QFP42204.1 V-type ATP synthase subunit D [Borrelia miyamotoi]QFP48318.1 V-type ATP synthase subunit D [Borrelia miyamotoi]QGT56079.1 V-type ATP synthase subunit D [Borrelia miyamotoi]QGT56859.1 V-type ATP synthase subunit D [Borrelia miyamotoi]WAZ72124.1 V-type ATP synthase subunit D [Borrelia miyamotoi]
MSKLKLTKNELKKQKDSLKMFSRYLPTLQLKKQQLYLEIRKVEALKRERKIEQDRLKRDIGSWIALFGERFPFRDWIQISRVIIVFANIAGITIPIFNSVEYEDINHDLLLTPYWVDGGIDAIKNMIKINVEIEVLNEQTRLLEAELNTTSQRVNLFDKIMIPTARMNIKKINVYLGDQQTAAVVRGKMAKATLIKAR